MKLHLPVILFRAVLALCVASYSVTLAEVPIIYSESVEYSKIAVDEASDIEATSSNAPGYIFEIAHTESGVSVSGMTSSLMKESNGSWFFVSADEEARARLSFSGSEKYPTLVVADGEKLAFLSLADLTIANNYMYYTMVPYGTGTTTPYFKNCKGASISAGAGTQVEMSGNESVNLVSNSIWNDTWGEDVYVRGAAVFADEGSEVHISGNKYINVNGNDVSTRVFTQDGYAFGGAVASLGGVSITGNAEVEFSGNYTESIAYSFGSSNATPLAECRGGAIYASGDIELCENGNISFSGNNNDASSSFYNSYSYGGAIYAGGRVLIENNNTLLFEGNSSSAGAYEGISKARGGAIYAEESVMILGNTAVIFRNNSVLSEEGIACGGSIAATGDIILQDNDSILFEGSKLQSSISRYTYPSERARGGVLSSDSSVDISDNGTVIVDGVTCEAEGSSWEEPLGMAVYSPICTIHDNDKVVIEQCQMHFTPLSSWGSWNSWGQKQGSVLSASELDVFSNRDFQLNNSEVSFEYFEQVQSGVNDVYAEDVYMDYISLNHSFVYADNISFNQNDELTFSLNVVSSSLHLSFENYAYSDDFQESGVSDAVNVVSYLSSSVLSTSDTETIRISSCGRVLFDGNEVENNVMLDKKGFTYSISKDYSGDENVWVVDYNDSCIAESRGSVLLGGYAEISDCAEVVFSSNNTKVEASIVRDSYDVKINASLPVSAGSYNEYRAEGGVAALDSTSLAITGGSVLFENNGAEASVSSSYKGVRYEVSAVETEGYNPLDFHESSRVYAYAGVMGSSTSLTITDVADGVTFRGNYAKSVCQAELEDATYVLNLQCITQEEYASGTYVGLSYDVHARGGVAAECSVFTLKGNASVSFESNYASAEMIGDLDDFRLSAEITCNEEISNSYGLSFSSVAEGGGISCVWGMDSCRILILENGDVSFIGNKAMAKTEISGKPEYSTGLRNGEEEISYIHMNVDSVARGGAIYGKTSIENNGRVIFSDNEAISSEYSLGGALSSEISYDSIILRRNDVVSFVNNKSIAAGQNDFSLRAYGGAIGGRCLDLSGNGDVLISGNVAICQREGENGYITDEAAGGAIYLTNGTTPSLIQNNGSVLFEKNAVVMNDSYVLNSIYFSSCSLSLSAAEGHSISFRDSITAYGSLMLNVDYVTPDGVTVRQQGDILFTGKYTETHLNEILADAEANRSATAEEICLSRTSEVNALTNLYGGRLRVEDGAIYQGQGITVHEDSEATVRVKDAELSHVGYNLTFNSGTSLEVAGESTIRGQVNLQEGSVFKLELGAVLCLHETAGDDAATLSVSGTAFLSGDSTLNAGLTLADGATLDMDNLAAGAVTLNGALTFSGQVSIGDNLLALLEDIKAQTEGMVLFTGIDSLTLPDVATTTASARMWAGSVFSNLTGQNYYLDYKAETGTLSIVSIPEPATATLSLLALAALAARRRRK